MGVRFELSIRALSVCLIVSGLSLPVMADQEPLQKTIDLLRDPDKRSEAIKSDHKAKSADDAAGKIGGEAAKQEIYDIAADIFPVIMEQANGDPIKMQEILVKAQKNPEAFYHSLSPAQRSRIKSLADKYPARKN